ncbi:MAG: hypothetical protein ACON35_08425 [Candidatus Marinamargulisbacteria bacterium]
MNINYQTIINSSVLGLSVYEWGLLAIVILASVIISRIISKKLNNAIIRIVQKLNLKMI